MKRGLFIGIIITCSAFFLSLLILDEEFVPDHAEQQIFEASLLAVVLAIMGIAAARYYGDKTTDDTIEKFQKKFVSEFDERLKNLESKFDKLQDSIKRD